MLSEYLQKAFDTVQPISAFLLSVIMYVLFPEDTYISAFCAVIVVMVLDVLTKYYCIAHNNNGLICCIKTGKIRSETLWRGTSRKIMDYLVIFVMVGLSYRVSPVAGVVVFLGTVVYGFIFLRECQSILENLEDAGHDVGWALSIVKRRKTKLMEDEGIYDEQHNNTDNNNI